MRFPSRCLGGAVVMALGGLCAGCGSGDVPTGSLQLALDSFPAGEYQALRLDLQRIDGRADPMAGEAGWVILSMPARVISLAGGKIDGPLPAQRSVPAGHYDALRLSFGPQSTILLRDGQLQSLAVPLSFGSTLTVPADISVPENAMAEGRLPLDGTKVMVQPRGDATSYSLIPAEDTSIQVSENPIGTISGRIMDLETGQGLPGVALFAESIDDSGRAAIMRTAVSGIEGCYTLTMLPVERSYYVVSRPYVNGVFYDPQSSGALPLSARAAQARFTMSIAVNRGPGSVTGELTPIAASNQSDQVNLLRQFTADGITTPWLIVDTTIAQSFGTETYSFTSVPPATYAVGAIRSTVELDGSIHATAFTQSPPFTVTASAQAIANLQY